MKTTWHFTDDDGTFVLDHPERTSYLYFPLANEAGMMSSITPELQGDAKTGQNAFLLAPVSAEDLHHAWFGRNFWLLVDGRTAWSAAGRSARQHAERFVDGDTDDVSVRAGFLWHEVVRKRARLGVQSTVTSLVPAGGGHVELMSVRIANTQETDVTITPTAAIPIYGRSADNIRDHRHVTSLLHRIRVTRHGVLVQPTLSFDERGHGENDVVYMVSGSGPDGEPPVGFFPIVEDFVGRGGSLDWPEAIVRNQVPTTQAGQTCGGYEALGGLRFATITLTPGQTATYHLLLGIVPGGNEYDVSQPPGEDTFNAALTATRQFWSDRINRFRVATGDQDFDRWMRWVTLQPELRRIYGCSFLPHHDYGRGGRGWRDLWQDRFAMLLMEPHSIREPLLNDFAGVRFDGSNATIIGSSPGEFAADRNDIARVWMDHGAWPFMATKLYIDQTGDLAFLLEEQSYFKDMHIHRCRARDDLWREADGTALKTPNGQAYRGSILEHLIIQSATAFFNVGPHNNCRLENADWNDGLDMASRNGESVAFTSFYGSNLLGLAQLIEQMEQRLGAAEVRLARECLLLLDSLDCDVDYASVGARRDVLARYIESWTHMISGETVSVPARYVAADLRGKGKWLLNHVRKNEWITNREGYAWFNGYYDNNSRRLEGDHELGVRMTLTGQVFAIMSGAATDEKIDDVIRSVDRYLWDDHLGGVRLNTDFREGLMNLGRCFGYAYGHKENGAVFCHMAVMYACALYERGRARAGHRVLDALYRQCMDFETAQVYPGIPEYFDPRGRGMYHYLTGSASWYLLTMLTRVFGLRGRLGDLVIAPALVESQFDARGHACVETVFAGRRLAVRYHNEQGKAPEAYRVGRITIGGEEVARESEGDAAIVSRKTIEALDATRRHELQVELV